MFYVIYNNGEMSMKNNKVFLSVIAALGISLTFGASAAVVSVTTGSNPYYQYQQENLASQQQQQPQTLPQSATNIQAQQRMQTMQQQNTQANTPFDPNAQSYQDAAKINQQGANQQAETQQNQSTGPKNAFEQGYGSEQDALAQQEALEEWASLQSARQKGETVNVPSFKSSNAVGNDKRSSVWLTNWKGVLVEQVGMKPEKVDFEASRLTKEEFAAWASRQVRYVEPNTIAVNP